MSIRKEAATIIDWIHGARYKGKKNGLDNMRALMDLLDNPQEKFQSVHVAGTNGKGSTCAFIERALRESGLKTGLYTSPYLCRFHERFRISGAPIDDAALVRLAYPLRAAFDALCERGVYPTTFELGTALAFLYFAEQRVDVAVIEVGLGGRLDPTNVIAPIACAIAAISIDHAKILGDTIGEIAWEKAGIIKQDVPVALYPQDREADAVFERVCRERGAPLHRVCDRPVAIERESAYGAKFASDGVDYEINLAGHHQIGNARLAIETLHILRERGLPIDTDSVREGLYRAEWPGRLEWLRPDLLIDGAHNLEGARSLGDYLTRYFSSVRKVLLTGMMHDKQYAECARALAGSFDAVITTRVDWPKALPAGVLADEYKRLGANAEAVEGIASALARARAVADGDLLVVAGSLYLIGDVRKALDSRPSG